MFKVSLIILFFLCCLSSKAQIRPYATVVTEWTVSGSYGGGSFGADLSRRLSMEAFYQTLLNASEIPFEVRQHLWGGILGYKFYQGQKGQYAQIQLRGGFSNTRFFVLWPTLVIGFKIKEEFSGILLNGIRFENPSLGVGISYNLEGLLK